MKIENITDDKIFDYIKYNYDNMEILKLIKQLLSVVIWDIEYMNKERIYKKGIGSFYDFGNGKLIKDKDYEYLKLTYEKIDNIENYNKEAE